MSPPSELRLAIHGPTAAAHELHTGRPGSFEAVMRALGAARGQGQRVAVASWLTRSSCRSLVGLAERLAAHGVWGWAIAWPRIDARTEAAAARIVPRLGIAVPHALRAVQQAQRRGVAVGLWGVPLCVLGPYAAQRLPDPEAAGRYAAACEGCPARAECPGVDGWYLDRFGAEELRPVEPVPRAELAPARVRGLVGAVHAAEGVAS